MKVLVVEKFRAFTDHYIRYVESFGKQACVWGALTHAKGDTPVKSENVIMSAWYNGYANPKDMIEQGYKLISIPDGLVYIVPAAGYYYDYLNTKYLYENWAPVQICTFFPRNTGSSPSRYSLKSPSINLYVSGLNRSRWSMPYSLLPISGL